MFVAIAPRFFRYQYQNMITPEYITWLMSGCMVLLHAFSVVALLVPG